MEVQLVSPACQLIVSGLGAFSSLEQNDAAACSYVTEMSRVLMPLENSI